VTQGFVLRVVDGPDCGVTAAIDRPIVVGRDGDLRLSDATTSRRHLGVEPNSAGLTVTDLGSSAGTFDGAHRISGPTSVDAGDVITAGATRLMVLRVIRFHPHSRGPGLTVRTAEGSRRVAITDGMTIGRDRSCSVVVPAAEVSRVHAVLRSDGSLLGIENRSTSNGTRVNGIPVNGQAALHSGDVIELGGAAARLIVSEADRSAGSVTVRARREGSLVVETLTLETSEQATVAEVAAALSSSLTADQSRSWLLYRPSDGIILHPDDEWSATGTQRGQELVLGRGDATLFPADTVRRWPRSTDGRVTQLPRTHWPAGVHTVARPTPPETTSFRGRGTLWQIIGGVGAVIVGLVMSIVNPALLAFGLMAGAIGIVSVGASIGGDQSRRKHRLQEYRQKIAALDLELMNEQQRQIGAAHDLSPEVPELSSWVADGSARLWERRPHDVDSLRLRIGRGRRSILIESERGRDADSPYAVEFDAVLGKYLWLDNVPVCGPGITAGGAGITGDGPRTRALATRMVVEAACLHAPHQLRLWVIANSPSWEWCRWLPHGGPDSQGARVSNSTDGATQLIAELRSNLEPTSTREASVIDLVIIDIGRSTGGVEEIIRDLSGRGHVVAIATDRRDLPNGLAIVIELDRDGGGTMVGSYPDAPVGPFVADSLDTATSERLAVALGSLGPTSSGTGDGGLLHALGLGDTETLDVGRAWAERRTEPLTVAIGTDEAGDPVTIGFRRDGPHGMVAGTTGSGKSELLQTLLTALAVTHSPSELALFLIDFKGGSTFAPLERLPHIVGMVTDLESDGSLAMRAFTALDAEIDRRKRLLDAARVPNIIDYSRLSTTGREPLPNLLVVIDEFALLVERQPEVKDRLDTVATQGRSLGIHLLLATQSPSGVITHAIRTNTNLWICLRVVTDAESMELLGTKDASKLPDKSPGRGFVRLGAGDDLRGFRAARIARPLPGEAPPVIVRSSGGEQLYSSPVERGPDQRAATTEMEVVVDRIVAAANDLGIATSTPLWLPPLPAVLHAEDIADVERPADRLVALVGLIDRPEIQRQDPFMFDLTASGHALVSGLLGFGKSTALLRIGIDLAAHHSPADVHLYGIEAGGGSLAPLTGLPHCASVVGVGDSERLVRMLNRLNRTVEERREMLAEAGASSFVRWRSSSGSAPWIVLLMDDYPSFRESSEQIDLGKPLELFNSLLQNGPAVGIHVVVAVSQSTDLRLSQTSLIPTRLLFRQSESAEYSLLELRLRPSEVPMGPPGRALTAGAAVVQVCVPDLDSVPKIAERWFDIDADLRPHPIERLPRSVDRSALSPALLPHLVGIGVGGPEVDTVAVRLGAGSNHLLIAGPLQSGRSTTLLSILEGLIAANPETSCTVVATRPGPMRDLDPSHPNIRRVVVDHAAIAEVLEGVADEADPHAVLLIDDAESISTVPGVSDRLDQLLRSGGDRTPKIIAAARVNDLPTIYDPWIRYLISLRRAVLLQPTADDAFIFGARLSAIPPPLTTGRGIIIDQGQVTVVQVCTPTTFGRDGQPT